MSPHGSSSKTGFSASILHEIPGFFQVFQVQFWPFTGIFWRFKAFFRAFCSVIFYSYACIVQCLLMQKKITKDITLNCAQNKTFNYVLHNKNFNSSKFNELIIILWFMILYLFCESQLATLKSAWKLGL